MAARIFIKRHVREGRVEQTIRMLDDFRKSAMGQPGYISGETLVNHYDPNCVVVVSTWQRVEDSDPLAEQQHQGSNENLLEDLLDKPTIYEIYDIHGASE